MPDFLDDKRASIALEATWELEQLCGAAIQAFAKVQDDGEEVHAGLPLARGALIRIKQLNSAIMSALGEGSMPTLAVRAMVDGVRREAT